MINDKRIFVDVHIIQTVPPSCVNRDDTGSPKTALYGGVRRARVSSQSWKRAMREMFREELDENELGVRTKKLVSLVADEIIKNESDISSEEAEQLAAKVINCCGISTEKKKDDEEKTKALFFVSRTQAENLARYILENKGKDEKNIKKDVKQLINAEHSIDIALFGRMVADDPSLNADASAQIAHSISTHRVENEYDYFTAIDDLAPEDNAGADMIGVVEYNSSTLYRYATVAVHNLAKELGGEKAAAARAVVEFAKAFIQSMPTGKQNTFANRTLPDAVLVTVRNDQPINLVGAFEEPVRTLEGGYVKKSIEKMEAYAENIYKNYLDAPKKSWGIGLSDKVDNVNLKKLLQNLKEIVEKELDTSGQG